MPSAHRHCAPPSAAATVRSAFTLIEVMIVIVIIGLLASIAVRNLDLSSTQTRETTFVRSLNSFVTAVQLYHAREPDFPPQEARGVIPESLESYLPPGAWHNETPIGGLWDIDRDDANVTFAIGVHYGATIPPTEMLERIDAIVDDGDLETGRFRRFGTNRFYLVLEE